jgi:hypothetical protein
VATTQEADAIRARLEAEQEAKRPSRAADDGHGEACSADAKEEDRMRQLKLTIGPPQDFEHVQFVVCRRISGRFLTLQGSEREICSKCEHPIWVKANSPKKPARICDECMADLVVAAEKSGDEVEMGAANQSFGEACANRINALAYWRRDRQ